MDGFIGCRELPAFVSQGSQVDPLEQPLPLSQQHRRDRNVQFINEGFSQILLYDTGPTANAHVHAVGCFARPVKRLLNTLRDEMEDRIAFHPN